VFERFLKALGRCGCERYNLFLQAFMSSWHRFLQGKGNAIKSGNRSIFNGAARRRILVENKKRDSVPSVRNIREVPHLTARLWWRIVFYQYWALTGPDGFS